SQRLTLALGLTGFADRVSVGGGHVDVTLGAASLGACFDLFPRRRIAVDVCGGAALGAMRGAGDGLGVDRSAPHIVPAGTSGVVFRHAFLDDYEWSLRTALLVPFARDGFSVDNAGTVSRLGPLGIVGGLGLGRSF